jgi:hypothetical protein
MPLKKQLFGLVPIPKKNHFSRSHPRKLLWKGVKLPSNLPLLTQKNLFGKEERNP